MTAGVIGAAVLAGCSTTQETAARLQLQSYREIAAETATVVRHASTTVTPGPVSLVRSGRRTAYVVAVQNRSGHAVSDLPISVGYVRDRHTVYANAAETLDYFQSHLGLIAAHSRVAWVFVGSLVPAGAHPFARVGTRAPADISSTPASPASAFRLTVSTPHSYACDCVPVTVTNHTGVPQYDLPVYVYGRRGHTVTAAARGSIATLNSGAAATVRLTLLGRADQLHVQVLPADGK